MSVFLDWTIEHRAQLVPLIFGFIGVYLLMPREQRALRAVGASFGFASAFILGMTTQPVGASLQGVLFYIFSGTAIVAAVSTVTQHNPIYSALSFALVTLSVCGLFLLRGAQFLAAATVIIYAGAIVVTFLFIIMLARQSGNASYDRRAREPFLATLASFVLLGGLLLTIESWGKQRAAAPQSPVMEGRLAIAETPGEGARSTAGFVAIPENMVPHPNSNVKANEPSRLRGLGRTLFTDYLIAVELAGTLLLVAGVGAVAIAPRRVKEAS